MGTQLPPIKGAQPTQFSTHVCCSQMAGLIKMPLGTEVCHGPGDIALDGDTAPPPLKRGTAPLFGSCLLWPNGWMDQDATCYGGRPRPRPRCVRWGCSSPKKAHTPNFRPTSILAKQSPISAAAEHLYLYYVLLLVNKSITL